MARPRILPRMFDIAAAREKGKQKKVHTKEMLACKKHENRPNKNFKNSMTRHFDATE